MSRKRWIAPGVVARFATLPFWRRWHAALTIPLLLLIGTPLGLLLVSSRADATSCSCNVFGTPTGQGEFSGSGLELGFKFKPNVNGFVTGVRFYKQGAMAGTHTGHLWTSGGSSLGTAIFSSETASGWQDVTFSSPVAVTTGTTYVGNYTLKP